MTQTPLAKTHPQITRIGLGTVQFGQDYGIANQTGQVQKQEVFKILNHAWKERIDTLDTAVAYGESEKVLGEFNKERFCDFKIISKLSVGDESEESHIHKMFVQSLENLQVDKIYGYLIHQFGGFLKHKHIWSTLENFKRKGQVEKLGFSLYSPEELEEILERRISFDLIQIPYSVFDQRFESYFEILKAAGIEIHVRSIFLQGMIFLKPNSLPSKLSRAKSFLEKLQLISVRETIPLSALCLNYVLLSPYVDKVIIGIDGLDHLKRNIRDLYLMEKVRDIKKQLDSLKIDDKDVLLPYRWK